MIGYVLATAAALLFGDVGDVSRQKPATFCVSSGASGGEWRCERWRNNELTPAGTERLFTSATDDGTILECGIVPKNASVPARSNIRRIEFEIIQSDRVAERTTIGVTQAGADRRWTFDLRGSSAIRPKVVLVPTGQYEVQINASHYKPVLLAADVTQKHAHLGTQTLVRLPTIVGSVRSDSGEPLAGAFVEASDGQMTTKTDTSGQFSLEPAGWPSSLTISYPGFGTKMITVPRPATDTTLAAVRLSKGGRLEVHVAGDVAISSAQLLRRDENSRWIKVHSESLQKPASVVTFGDVDPGTVVAVISGNGPLEHFGFEAAIHAGETVSREMRVEPFDVDVEVTRGGKPVPGAAITVRSRPYRWESALATNAEGHVAAKAWQEGDYFFSISGADGQLPFANMKAVHGDGVVHIELPDRTIAGRVVGDDGGPIKGAELQVDSENEDGTESSLSVPVDANGGFRFDVRAGTHSLTARAAGYTPSDKVTVQTRSVEALPDIRILVHRGGVERIRVVDRTGRPLRAAALLHGIVDRVLSTYVTDETGRAEIHTAGGDENRGVLYILPREGSIAVERLRQHSDNREREIVVPDGIASVEVHVVDEKGNPIPDVRFLMRIAGEVIPPSIAAAFERISGITVRTRKDGIATLRSLPATLLELWPLRSSEEMTQTYDSITMTAPVQVGVQPGKNVAVLTFSRKN